MKIRKISWIFCISAILISLAFIGYGIYEIYLHNMVGIINIALWIITLILASIKLGLLIFIKEITKLEKKVKYEKN